MEEMAIRVLCPIHGVRLQKSYQVYVSEWLRKSYQTFCGRTTVPNFEKPGLPRFRPTCGRPKRRKLPMDEPFFGLRMGQRSWHSNQLGRTEHELAGRRKSNNA